jgi:hypothetical protein
VRVEGREPGHSYHKIIATDAVAASVFPREELDDARRALPDAMFGGCTSANPLRRWRQSVWAEVYPGEYRPEPLENFRAGYIAPLLKQGKAIEWDYFKQYNTGIGAVRYGSMNTDCLGRSNAWRRRLRRFAACNIVANVLLACTPLARL